MTTINATGSTPSQTPRIVRVQVIPVAAHDSMLLNLSGAHGLFSPATT